MDAKVKWCWHLAVAMCACLGFGVCDLCARVSALCVRKCARSGLGSGGGLGVCIVDHDCPKRTKRSACLLQAFPDSCERLSIFADITPPHSRDANMSPFFKRRQTKKRPLWSSSHTHRNPRS